MRLLDCRTKSIGFLSIISHRMAQLNNRCIMLRMCAFVPGDRGIAFSQFSTAIVLTDSSVWFPTSDKSSS